MPNHVCPQCAQPFYHRKSARRFCSLDCYHAYERHHPNIGTFATSSTPVNKAPVGTSRVRRRHNRREGPRVWVKVAEPNVWRLRAAVKWENAHGHIPAGFVIHHRNRNTVDDRIENLELITRAEHLAEHRPEFEDVRKVAAVAGRRKAAVS